MRQKHFSETSLAIFIIEISLGEKNLLKRKQITTILGSMSVDAKTSIIPRPTVSKDINGDIKIKMPLGFMPPGSRLREDIMFN